MLWSKIFKNKQLPLVLGLLAVTCTYPPWQIETTAAPAFTVFGLLWQPPDASSGIAWSVLLCQWAMIIFAVVGLSQNWKKFAVGAFAAMILGISIYLVATLLSVATQQPKIMATKQTIEETSNTDATKDGTDLFDEAAKILAK
jgi:hypothetical protein